MRESTQEVSGTMVASEGHWGAAVECPSRGRRRAVLRGLRADFRWSGSQTVENSRGDRERRPSAGSREMFPSRPAEDRDAIHRRRRRYEQLQFAEERLRPLLKTKLAEVYWRVYAELHRVGREIVEGSGLESGGSRLDRE
ncbi:hypothetical protein [Singulisphaera acidiphila]|uniref:Uncharacterized protein n=1 Tax=Singulisphaera acidiphila (strain ATCC BAA-1392 / DSM 18658 / VKM B-2454 / MOB10) TaxID=886293 RepID=L0DFR8_SINAD|nr:hypothetical protein [Singulisphaera acidiphila]AGA27700.1 hypothetical protein Sinac_3439 [Singulisphaera acidiphila DSM 18658]